MRVCEIEGCEKKHHAKGLCRSHNDRRRYDAYVASGGGCAIPCCDLGIYRNGYCVSHNWKFKQYGLSFDQIVYVENLTHCQICAIAFSSKPRGATSKAIDHDKAHPDPKTAEAVRGVICFNCNLGIGHFNHETGRVQNAVRFLIESDFDTHIFLGTHKDRSPGLCYCGDFSVEDGGRYYCHLCQTRRKLMRNCLNLTPTVDVWLVHETVDWLLERQCYRCPISGEPVDRSSHLDHDHTSDNPSGIRGMLAPSSNVALGFFKDDPILLRAAAKYLDNPPGIPS